MAAHGKFNKTVEVCIHSVKTTLNSFVQAVIDVGPDTSIYGLLIIISFFTLMTGQNPIYIVALTSVFITGWLLNKYLNYKIEINRFHQMGHDDRVVVVKTSSDTPDGISPEFKEAVLRGTTYDGSIGDGKKQIEVEIGLVQEEKRENLAACQ